MAQIINPLKSMRIRSEKMNHTFGMVRTKDDGSPKPHQGWDLQAPIGTEVIAITDGWIDTVKHGGDYGNQIILRFSHNNKTYFAHYAHLSMINVMPFINVKAGQVIGHTGDSGNASGLPINETHLHFEIREIASPGKGLGNRVDPGEVLGWDTLSCQKLKKGHL